MKFESGCSKCYDKDPVRAWDLFKNTVTLESLINESHFSIRIRQCRACDQKYLAVFTETIDWQDGQDPQLWSIVPVAPDEIAVLINAGSDDSDVSLVRSVENAVMERQSLCLDWPKGSDQKIFWRKGIIVGLHD